MYYAHFGLVRPPFRITPDPTLFFSGADRGSVLEALAYVVMSGEGITKVIGEVGSGKTMLCRMLEEKLPEQVETIYIANPNISPENILNAIAFEAGFSDQPDNKMELMQLFQSWLVECHASNKRVVVLIEEAQGMPVPTLEEIRLLSNLETGEDKLMQIVLFGQPELDQTLARVEIRQLQDRIAHNFYLSPFTAAQIQEYLNFRVREAGYRGPDLFDEVVCRTITRASKGLIRRVNILADKTLLVAFSAGTSRILKTHVKTAIRDSKFTDSRRPWPLWQAVGAGIAAGVLLAGLSAWLFWPSSVEESAIASRGSVAANNHSQVAHVADKQPVDEQKEEAGLADTDSIDALSVPEDSDLLQVADVSRQLLEPESALTDTDSTGPELRSQEPDRDESIDQLVREAVSTSMLKSRLLATERWIAQAGDQQYSIQLMMLKASSSENLNYYLKEISKTIDLNDIFVYETELGEGPMLGVLYQRFPTRRAALKQMQNMPAAFDNIEPFLLRSIRGLRNEIADNK